MTMACTTTLEPVEVTEILGFEILVELGYCLLGLGLELVMMVKSSVVAARTRNLLPSTL